MSDSFTIIVAVISAALGAGFAFMALKNRSEQGLHSKEAEIAALKAKEAFTIAKYLRGVLLDDTKHVLRSAGSSKTIII